MAGYSGTPLIKKLGIKPAHTVYIHNAPEDYWNDLGELPPGITVEKSLRGSFDFIHLFVTDLKSLRASFRKAKTSLKKDGMMWISWPKKSSGMQSDLNENVIREYGLSEGLVDTKVCAVDEIWSGLKFVYRIKDR